MFIWTFLLRITRTIISRSIADSSWITLYCGLPDDGTVFQNLCFWIKRGDVKVRYVSPQYYAVVRRCQTCHNSSLSQIFEIYWHAFARSEVLVTTLMESRNFRDVTSCRMINSCLHLESPSICRRKDGGRKPLWNWVILSVDTAHIPGHLNFRTDIRQFQFSFSLFLSLTAFSRPAYPEFLTCCKDCCFFTPVEFSVCGYFCLHVWLGCKLCTCQQAMILFSIIYNFEK